MLPNECLVIAGNSHPTAWKRVEMFRQSRGADLPKWPSWCFLPMAAWYAIVTETFQTQQLNIEQAAQVSKLAAIGTWRYSQGIYRYQPEFYKAVTATVPNGELPSEVFYRLPEWCIYVETPEMKWFDEELYGFWCHLEWDVNAERTELRLLMNTSGRLVGVPIHIGPWTLTEAMDSVFVEAKKQAQTIGETFDPSPNLEEKMSASLHGIVSMILYLCSEEPEIDDMRQPGSTPERPKAKKTKQGWRLFPAEKPRIWVVGEHIGQALSVERGSYEKSDGVRSVRPHFRRAHWHGYWTGPRDGERKFLYKWLPPLLVRGTSTDEDNE